MGFALVGLCAAAVGFVLVGYPLLVALMARVAPRPIHKRFTPRTVSVVIPVHNGAAALPAKMATLAALDYPRELVEIFIVSDGSTDGTEQVARTYAGAGVKLLSIPRAGKSAALNAALAEATGEILFFTDLRQALEPRALRYLVECLGDPRVGVVSGELIIRDGATQEEADVGLYWRYEKWIRKNICAFSSFPGATGSIYAMRRELARRMPPYTLCDDMYLPLAAHLGGARIVFEDRARAYDQPSPLEAEFGRKVRTLAGVYQIAGFLPGVLNPLVPVFPHFVCHKLGRLVLPWAMLGILAGSLLLPWPWWAVWVAAQAGFYLLAAANPVVPQGNPLKRVTSIVHTFVSMMLAAMWAASIAYRPAATFWKPTRAG